MEEKDNILSEIQTVAPGLAGIGSTMPFTVPDDYFELFPFQMLTRVAPLQNPSVPDGYFDSLPLIMLAKVKSQGEENELGTIAPVLAGISREMPYSVPAGYFENLSASPVKTPAVVVPISSGSKRNIFKWAAAASVIILAGLFGWQWFSNSSSVTGPQVVVSNAIDSTSNSELAAGLSKLTDTSLDIELDATGIPEDTRSALFYLETENFETALHDFTDEELKAQLADQVTIKNKS